MAYKDKDKQRKAVREATQRYRQRLKGITGITQATNNVIPAVIPAVIPDEPEPQSHSPMMVGYVPPTE